MLDRTDDELDAVDRDALERAMAIARKDPSRSEQLDSMLDDGQPWVEVAQFASCVAQSDSLKLRPWESPPCWGAAADPQAAELLDRMLAAGLSQWEPTPIEALAKPRKRRPR